MINKKIIILLICSLLVLTSCNNIQIDKKSSIETEETKKNENTENTYNIKKSNPDNSDQQVKKQIGINNEREEFNGLPAFWNNFKTLILNNDIDEIEKLTKFPLETRGTMDYHPIIKFDRDKFKSVFSLFLNKNCVFSKADGKLYQGTMLDQIIESGELFFKNPVDYQNSKDYTKTVLVQDNHADIYGMVFTLENNQWKMTFIYLGDETYEKLGIDIE